MDPISTAIAGYATDKMVTVAETVIKTQVIERWGRHRARKFFEAFCAAMVDLSTTDEELRDKLEELLSHEERSQVLFDAYRSVCLTKSRNTGPRIIALLTAELVIAGRTADEDDEAIFAAAEELTDAEFEQVAEYISEIEHQLCGSHEPKTIERIGGALRILVDQQTSTSSWPSRDERSLASLDLAHQFGTWALKLKRLGLLGDDIKERQWRYQEDSERHIDESGTASEITWWVILESPALKLASFVRHAGSPNEV